MDRTLSTSHTTLLSKVSEMDHAWDTMIAGESVVNEEGKETSMRAYCSFLNRKYKGERHYKVAVNRSGPGVIITRVY